MAELHRIKAIWPQPFIELADDNTFVNKGHSKELLRAFLDEPMIRPAKVIMFTSSSRSRSTSRDDRC